MDLILFAVMAFSIIILMFLSAKYEANGQTGKQRVVHLIVSLIVAAIPLAWFVYIVYLLVRTGLS